jgi:hypothetical protein
LKDKEERRRGRRTQQIEEEWCTVALVSLEAFLFFLVASLWEVICCWDNFGYFVVIWAGEF